MSEGTENVINFILSKDLKIPVKLGLQKVSGLSSSQLLNRIKIGSANDADTSDLQQDPFKSSTSVLINSNLHHKVPNITILCSIHLESGNGKRLTVPLIKGLKGDVDSKHCISGMELTSEELTLSFRPLSAESHILNNHSISNSTAMTNEWMKLPLNYSQVPLNSTVVIKIYCLSLEGGAKVLLGEGRVQLFDDTCVMKRGKHKVPIQLVDPKDSRDELKKVSSLISNNRTDSEDFENNGQVSESRPDWLMTLSNKKLVEIEKNGKISKNNGYVEGFTAECLIEFTSFDSPVIYSDIKYAALPLPSLDIKANEILTFDPSFNEISYRSWNINDSDSKPYPSLAPFDPDIIRNDHNEDPVEQKFRRLERTQHLSELDKEIKPITKTRAILSAIMSKQFFENVSAKERNIVWRYRWFLLNNLVNGNKSGWNNFAINFIKCVDWGNPAEVNDLENILKSLSDGAAKKSIWSKYKLSSHSSWWVFEQELEIIDCLELLTGIYQNKIIRRMAVNRLKHATDEELSMFMVQLVQNIKFEIFEEEGGNLTDTLNEPEGSVEQSMDEEVMEANHYDDPGPKYISSSTYTIESSEYQLVDGNASKNNSVGVELMDRILSKKNVNELNLTHLSSPLADFVISRAVLNPNLTYTFYWSLKVEVDEERVRNYSQKDKPNRNDFSNNSKCGNLISNIYETTMIKLIMKLKACEHGFEKVYDLRRQIEFVKKLHEYCMKLKVDYKKETTIKKVELLKHMLSDKQKRTVFSGKPDNRNEMSDDSRYETMVTFPAIALPLDPTIIIDGTFPENSSVFKSSLSPIKIDFKTIQGLNYEVMYKIGDDLRQDQFITQLIYLMENILKNENMDLKLKPYKILATGPVEGFIQFIPNSSLSSILAKYNNSILSFLRAHNPDESASLGVKADVMDTYVRSCAGYCVVTYILGIGDRHLENLLLSPDGHFFHADFGYILGHDPKPFPPLMKLPIQIIEGMGGLQNNNYKAFCQLCFITYITLRKNASLILNLVQLMINTSIPALFTSNENSESEKQELLWKVQEKFMLDMNDEEAVLHFQNLIDDSVSAFLPVVIDRLHSMAQYWRS